MKKSIIILFCLLLVYQLFSQQNDTWSTIGTRMTNLGWGSPKPTFLYRNSNGTLFAGVKESSSRRPHIIYLEEESQGWQEYSTEGFETPNENDNDICIGEGGQFFLASAAFNTYYDGVRVFKVNENGTSNQVGPLLLGGYGTIEVELVINSNNELIVAGAFFDPLFEDRFLNVYRLVNGQWNQVGETIDDFGVDLELEIDSDDNLYLHYSGNIPEDTPNRNYARVVTYSGNEWSLIGDDYASPDYIGQSCMYFENNQSIYVLFLEGEGENSGHLSVSHFDGNSWEFLLDRAFFGGEADPQLCDIVKLEDGNTYVMTTTWLPGGNSPFYMFKAGESQWELVENNGIEPPLQNCAFPMVFANDDGDIDMMIYESDYPNSNNGGLSAFHFYHDLEVGIKDSELSGGGLLFPNILSGNRRILNIKVSKYSSLKIFDLVGNLKYESKLSLDSGNQVDIPSTVATGLYIAVLSNDSSSCSEKLILK